MAQPQIDKIDLLEGSYQFLWNGTYMQEQAVRVATVSGLGSGTMDAALAMTLATQTVQKTYPIAQRLPGGSRAIIFGYGSGGIFPDLVKVKIIYDTPYGAGSPPGGGTPFVRSDTTSIERVTSGYCPGPNGVPIQITVWWQDPNNKMINIVWPGTITYDRTLRTTTATGIVTAAQLAAYSPFSNYVNQNPWNGLGVAYWKLNVVQSSTLDLGKNYNVQIEAQADTTRDWSQYTFGRNPNAGNRVIAVDQQKLKNLAGQKYAPQTVLGLNDSIGVVRSCPYLWTDFRAIFGF